MRRAERAVTDREKILQILDACRYQSVIGTGRIGEVTDMEEKKQALAAIMAHYEPEKSFVFTDEQAQHVAVFRLDVAELTCKERS